MYRIKISQYCYPGMSGAPMERFLFNYDLNILHDNELDPLEYATKGEAQKIVDRLKRGDFDMENDGFTQPKFKIVMV